MRMTAHDLAEDNGHVKVVELLPRRWCTKLVYIIIRVLMYEQTETLHVSYDMLENLPSIM